MADGVSLPAAAGKAATREVTYSGETMQAQTVGLATFAGSDDAKTATDVTTTNPLPVGAVGDVAHDAADTGNPVKIGGYANTSAPVAVANGDRVNVWHGLNGQIVVSLGSGSMTAADGVANTNELALINPGGNNTANMLPVHEYVFNGTTWDRLRGDAANGVDVDVTRVAGTPTNAAGQVTISSTSATVIASRAGRRAVMLINNQPVPVYLDPSGGTAATTHMRLDPGASVVLPVTSAITGITAAAYTAAGDAKVHYAELY